LNTATARLSAIADVTTGYAGNYCQNSVIKLGCLNNELNIHKKGEIMFFCCTSCCYTPDDSSERQLLDHANENPVELDNSLEKYVTKLSNLPLNSIIDRGEGEKKCREIGQSIFDKYKKQSRGDSLAGREAVVTVCDNIAFSAIDGRLRKQYIERAWDGIGDKSWSWQS
jgi:hypothetical protein